MSVPIRETYSLPPPQLRFTHKFVSQSRSRRANPATNRREAKGGSPSLDDDNIDKGCGGSVVPAERGRGGWV